MSNQAWSPRGITFSRNDGAPKYVAIARALGSAITEGDLAPGEVLPSQRELAESFQVTIMTVRQAIALLEEQGMLVAQQGRGTYVTRPPFRLPLGTLSSLADQARATGHELRTEVLSHGPVPISPLEQRRMGLVEAEAYEIVRLRSVEGKPLVLQASLLPLGLGSRLDVSALVGRPLYDVLLEEVGVRVQSATETVQATTLEADTAGLLRRAVGDAALLSIRLTRSSDGKAVVDDRALVPGDSVMISAERRADQSGVTLILNADPETLPVPSPFVRSGR